MNTSLQELYQRLILEHNRSPHNHGPLPAATHSAQLHNALCGDRVTLRLQVLDERIAQARFEGDGCALSRAAASLLTDRVRGQTVPEARQLAGDLGRFLGKDEAQREELREQLGELVALEGVREFPSRLRCATLPAEALTQALAQAPQQKEGAK